MVDVFQTRVRAAAIAGWWTLLIAAAFVTVQWLGYLAIVSAKPAWVQPFFGPEATWESIRTLWLYALGFLKLSLWPLAVVALWLTLWARQLGKREHGAPLPPGPGPGLDKTQISAH